MPDDTPKSALELAMERLRRKDEADGVTQAVLTDEQKARLAEARSVLEARQAETRILYASRLRATFEPAELEAIEAEMRRELARLQEDYDSKARSIRAAGSST
jgi:hypothetical protein